MTNEEAESTAARLSQHLGGASHEAEMLGYRFAMGEGLPGGDAEAPIRDAEAEMRLLVAIDSAKDDIDLVRTVRPRHKAR